MRPFRMSRSAVSLIVLQLLLSALCSGQKVEFTDCGPGSAKSVTITPCDSMPCIFYLDTVVSVEFEFVSPVDTATLEEVVKGVVRGRELPFPEKPKDPCAGFISPGCPIVAGNLYTFKASFGVKPFYPAIPIQVKYSLVTPGGEVVMCIMTGAKILDPNPKPKGRRRGKKD